MSTTFKKHTSIMSEITVSTKQCWQERFIYKTLLGIVCALSVVTLPVSAQEKKPVDVLWTPSQADMVANDGTNPISYQMDDQHPFNWIDISDTGTPLSLYDDDHYYPISFDFNFYGNPSTSIAVGSNGYISFDAEYLGLSNPPIPSTSSSTSASFIAVFWDDLNPSAGGEVFYDIQGTTPNRTLIIQWDSIPRYSNYGESSFQVVLEEATGSILMQYQDVEFENADYDNGASATVGLQKDSSYGQQYSYNTPLLSNGMAIKWSLPVLSSCDDPAIFSLQKKTLTVPFTEIQIINFLTGQPTDEVELWAATLKQVTGTVDRFIIKGQPQPITDDSSSDCPATYAPESGTLFIPYIEVPTGISMGNKNLQNNIEVFEAMFRWDPLGNSFVVQQVNMVQ